MGDSLIRVAMLLAQAEGDNPGPSPLVYQILFMWLPIGLLFYFLLIRPQSKERAKRQGMISQLKENDRIVTVGGMYGTVTNVHREADEVTIRVDDKNNTRIRVTLGAISRVFGDEPTKGEAPSK
jgi:preprotein translocase subunit YajC